tara:strand:- start:541 stop:2082 length:1542 start_codon:yes stop_codon:yes gene_type:complete
MNQDFENKIKSIIGKFKINDFDFVINKSKILLKKNSNNDFLWNIQGLSFQYKGEYIKSINCFKKAIQFNPENFSSKNNLGNSYKYLKDFTKAEKCFNEILEIEPNYINALINLGNLKIDLNTFDEAVIYLNKALKLDKDNVNIYINLANAYMGSGELPKAKEILLVVLKMNPSLTRADKMLSDLSKSDESVDEHLNQMLIKLKELNLNDEQKVNLYFAIAKKYDDKKEYKMSFEFLSNGNKLQRKNITYNTKDYETLSSSIKAYFSNYKYGQKTTYSSNKKVIFVLGMPRSGTTLTENIISSHSKVASLGELNFIGNQMRTSVTNNFTLNSDLVVDFLKEDFYQSYFDHLKPFKISKSIVVDKSLDNFWYIGFIKNIFPNSKIIHCQRNPKDICLSIFKNLFNQSQGWHCNEEELADYYNIYSDLMQFWNNELKDEILNLQYEDLTKNTEHEIKKIINFCDLDWEENCLNFYKNKNPIKTLSVNQANKPIYQSSVNSFLFYKKELNALFSRLK